MATDFDAWSQALAEAGRRAREGDLGGAAGVLASALPALPDLTQPVVRDLLDALTPPAPPASDPAPAPPAAADAAPGSADAAPRAERRKPRAEARPAAKPAAPAQPMLSGEHTEAAGTREYRLFLPPPQDARPPLVVMLHGCHQEAEDLAAGSGMNERAAAQGCAVLYPMQSRRAHPQGCWQWYQPEHQQRGRGEPSILAGMVRAVVRRHGFDRRRIWVAGLSAGGAMAALLGAAYPDLFAAVGVQSGLPAGAAQDLPSAMLAMQAGAGPVPERSVHEGRLPPTIVFHGSTDVVVNPANGERLAAAVAASHGAHVEELQRGRRPGGRGFTRRVWLDADGHAAAELWLVHGGLHGWSGGRPVSLHVDPIGPDASDRMLHFFFEHPGPERG